MCMWSVVHPVRDREPGLFLILSSRSEELVQICACLELQGLHEVLDVA